MSQQFGNDDPTIQFAENAPASKPSHEASSAAYQDNTPKSFGRYRVVSMLGKGGFGAVYRAVDDQLERNVAIKVTLGSLLDPSMRQGFLTWGMHDMHGNVWEWHGSTSDWGVEGVDLALCGGSWQSVASECQSSSRLISTRSLRSNIFGVRLALSPSRIPQ